MDEWGDEGLDISESFDSVEDVSMDVGDYSEPMDVGETLDSVESFNEVSFEETTESNYVDSIMDAAPVEELTFDDEIPEAPMEFAEEVPEAETPMEVVEEIPEEISEAEAPAEVAEENLEELFEDDPAEIVEEIQEEIPEEISETEAPTEVVEEIPEAKETYEMDETAEDIEGHSISDFMREIPVENMEFEDENATDPQVEFVSDVTEQERSPEMTWTSDELEKMAARSEDPYFRDKIDQLISEGRVKIEDGSDETVGETTEDGSVMKREITPEVWASRMRDTEETLNNYRENLRDEGVDESQIERFVMGEKEKIYKEFESLDRGDTSSNIYYMPTDWKAVADSLDPERKMREMPLEVETEGGVGDISEIPIGSEIVETVKPENRFGSFETGKYVNNDTIVKGDHFDQYIKEFYDYDNSTYESLNDNSYFETISPSAIEGIHLGEREAADENIFWSQHEKGGTMDSFKEIASHIPEVQRQLDSGKSLAEIMDNEELEKCASIYFDPQNIPRVVKGDNYYEFQGNGRHRILAARELGYDIPVHVVSKKTRNI